MKNLLFIFGILFSVTSIAQDIIAQDLIISDYVEGTLLTPNSKTSTLAIIIPGSGPTDRDGNQNFMKNNSLKFLAHDLTDKGIATFRYDKRALTMLKKGANEKQIKKVRFDHFVTDAKKVVSYFKNRKRYDKIFIIGHSQGSLVGILAATENVDGLISIAGAGKSIDQIILDQIGMMGANDLVESAKKTFDIMKTGKVDKNFNPGLANIFNLDVQPFIMNWISYSPTEELAKLTIPTLIINGTNDIQVSTTEAELLKKAKEDSVVVIIENMNHVLKTVASKDPQENTKSYNMPQLKNAPELAKEIIAFIK
ncbi:MAG: alpha/beta hydrolase [Flavobacteriaceae bacterium]|nr:alpha/beta hydrolase [Flavobacteriaceae bacterium]